MRVFACLIGLTASAVLAQKLETLKPDTTKVIRVETARDHLTVIEVADPVTMVAVGNQNAFTIERRGDKVFVRPAEDDARTNLFIWTQAGRFAYELVPAPTVDQMHFAIDQAPRVVAAKTAAPESAIELAQKPAPMPTEMLIHAAPVSVHGDRESRGRVEITLRDLYRRDGKLYLRYALMNRSNSGYYPTRPAVWQMAGVRSTTSLISFRGSQLGERLARSVKASTLTPVNLLDADQSAHVAAGDCGFGWIAIEDPENSGGPSPVLKLEFAADAKGAVSALLVLKPTSNRPEVARAEAARDAAAKTGNR
jgi:hypothetical protein